MKTAHPRLVSFVVLTLAAALYRQGYAGNPKSLELINKATATARK